MGDVGDPNVPLINAHDRRLSAVGRLDDDAPEVRL
jgi:hypothetical protein